MPKYKIKARRISPYTRRAHGKRVRVSGHTRHYAVSSKLRGILPPVSSGHGKLSKIRKTYRRSGGGKAFHKPNIDRQKIALHRAEPGKPYTGD